MIDKRLTLHVGHGTCYAGRVRSRTNQRPSRNPVHSGGVFACLRAVTMRRIDPLDEARAHARATLAHCIAEHDWFGYHAVLAYYATLVPVTVVR